jgi:hypothetical protein
MDEVEWRKCDNPQAMLKSIRGQASARKLRLVAVACCYRIWSVLTDERARRSVVVAEGFADEVLTRQERAEARKQARSISQTASRRWKAQGFPDSGPCYAANCGYGAAARVSCARAWEAAVHLFSSCTAAAAGSRNDGAARKQEAVVQCALVRDLFDLLVFAPVAISPAVLAWNNGTLMNFARTIYDERAFDRLPILADALEDAGCTDAAILDHLRGPGPHTRGCFALDLVLGKS